MSVKGMRFSASFFILDIVTRLMLCVILHMWLRMGTIALIDVAIW